MVENWSQCIGPTQKRRGVLGRQRAGTARSMRPGSITLSHVASGQDNGARTGAKSCLVGSVLGVGVGEVELRGTGGGHHDVKDGELTGREGADHDATGAEAGEAELLEARLLGEVDEARGDGARAAGGRRLVDHRQQGVGRVRDDGGGNTGDGARRQRDGHLGRLGGGLHVGARGGGNGLGGLALDGELGHGVRDLLEQNRAEAGVEALEHAVVLDDLRDRGDEARRELRVRHEADAGGLERAQEDVGDELGARRGHEVDHGAVVPRLLVAEVRRHVDLEELNTAELEPALDEVADGGRAEARGEAGHALLGDDGAEARDHTLVVLLRLELDAGLDDVDGAHGTVGHRAADAAGEGTLDVVRRTVALGVTTHVGVRGQ
mmetsp:Transcript_18283/g.56712  ORF Transcript_18283/g.56712 Transcript_18283/m.56712 type:complete len:378 (-) Transcript_18283:16-1149(-)